MFYTAFILGIISSLHCIGMCGPIAMMLPLDQKNPAKKALQILTYHIGRLTAYGSIGFVFGLIGKGFYLAGIQQKLSLFIGIAMVLYILIPEKKMVQKQISKPIFGLIAKIKTALGNQFRNKSYPSLFTIGLLNGFLPCGLVYMALFGALAMQNSCFGVFYMVLFGLGTLPMMSGVIYLNNFLTLPLRNKIQKIIPYVAIIIGLLFILRGLGLGISYISPSNMSLFVQENPNCH